MKMFRTIPSAERLMRTVFWTFWTMSVGVTTYGLCVEQFGIGLFLPDERVFKLYMTCEAELAGAVGIYAMIGLLVMTIIISHWSRWLRGAGIVALLYFLVDLAIPRF